jgi:hypothetical protein
MATKQLSAEATAYLKDHAAEIAAYETRTGNTFDPDGPALDECEDCGEAFQYMVDTEFGKGHSCHGTRCASAEAARYEDAAYGRDCDGDDYPDFRQFEG